MEDQPDTGHKYFGYFRLSLYGLPQLESWYHRVCPIHRFRCYLKRIVVDSESALHMADFLVLDARIVAYK